MLKYIFKSLHYSYMILLDLPVRRSRASVSGLPDLPANGKRCTVGFDPADTGNTGRIQVL